MKISYDAEKKGHYARGFLFSTKQAGGPEGYYRINRDAGHGIAKTAKSKHFIIRPDQLQAQSDGHFYDSGLANLLRGYEANSHGVIEEILGPFYYPDKSGDYWYDFNMRLRDGKSSSVLQEYGPKLWTRYAVSPHFWDFPELNQDPQDLKKAEIVGVALVMEGFFGPQAVISKMCKGDRQACYSARGLASAANHHCGFNCQCDICKVEDEKIAEFLTSQLGKSSSKDPNINLDPNQTGGTPDVTKGAPAGSQTPTNEPGKFVINDKIVSEAEYNLHKEYEAKLKEAKLQGKAEADQEWKSQNEILIAESKQNTFDKIFSPELVTDEAQRKALYTTYSAMDLTTLKTVHQAINDYRTHAEPALKTKLKAELEKPEGDKPDTPPAGGGEGGTKAADKNKGKASSQNTRDLPKETTHKNLPSDESEEGESKGGEGDKGKASSKPNEIRRFRNAMMGVSR